MKFWCFSHNIFSCCTQVAQVNQPFLLHGSQGLQLSNTHQAVYTVASTDWKSLRFCWMFMEWYSSVNSNPICSWFHEDECSLLKEKANATLSVSSQIIFSLQWAPSLRRFHHCCAIITSFSICVISNSPPSVLCYHQKLELKHLESL